MPAMVRKIQPVKAETWAAAVCSWRPV